MSMDTNAGPAECDCSCTNEPTRADRRAEASVHPDLDLEDVVVEAKPVRRFPFKMKVRRVNVGINQALLLGLLSWATWFYLSGVQ